MASACDHRAQPQRATATCHHWHFHITRLDRDLMQSEFENVIGVLPKISGGSRGGLGGGGGGGCKSPVGIHFFSFVFS